MNKRSLRIAGWAIGLSLAFCAIGTAVGASQAAPIEAAAEEQTINFSAQGYTNNQAVSSTAGTHFRVDFTDGSTPTAYFTTGTGVRVYGGGSFSVVPDEGYTITAAAMTFSGSSYAPNNANQTNIGELTPGQNATWSGESLAGFTVSRPTGSGHWRFQSITVTLAEASSDPTLSLSQDSIIVTLGTTETITATPSSFATGTVTYGFDTNACATLSHTGNTISIHGDVVGQHTFTITGFVGEAKQASAELAVNVVNPYPTKINRTDYTSFTDAQTFAQGAGSIKITYSDESTSTKHLGDTGVKLLISDVEVSAETSAANYLGVNSAKIQYTEEGHTVSTNAFNLTVVAELAITSVENVPEYLIIDPNDSVHSKTVTVNYSSLKGEPSLSIVSSDPTKLVLDYDEEDNVFEGTEGLAEFTLTAGTAPGQYYVTISLTYGARTETRVLTVNVRGEAPAPSAGSYVLIDDIADLQTGEYIIAGKPSSSYYGMTRTVSSSKFSGTASALAVTDGAVASSAGDSACFTFNITGTGASKTATIKDPNTNQYVRYNGNKTEVTKGDTYNWTVSAGSAGTFRFASGTTGRALAYRASSNVFAAYATSNIGGSDPDYFDLELFKYVETVDPFDLVDSFVTENMHMVDAPIADGRDTGNCKGDSGYYLTAKKAWNAMVKGYDGEENLVTVFTTDFPAAYSRYMRWAAAMNDAGPFDGNDSVITPIHALGPSAKLNSGKLGAVPMVVAFVGTGLAAAGGLLFLHRRHRKED